MIAGVHVKKLKVIEDERGLLMEMLRSDDSFFNKFGQVYLSVCNIGYAKAWHYHKKQTDNFAVVFGRGRIGLFDRRDDSSTKGEVNEFVSEPGKRILVTIPPGVVHGFEAIGEEPCYLINCPTELYDYKNPDEHRMPFNSSEIPFKWNASKGG